MAYRQYAQSGKENVQGGVVLVLRFWRRDPDSILVFFTHGAQHLVDLCRAGHFAKEGARSRKKRGPKGSERWRRFSGT